MARAARLRQLVDAAASDETFELLDTGGRRVWRGKCLFCNGFLEFDDDGTDTREATVEHLLARANGGTDALENLAVVHPRCNHEKGRNTDPLGPGDPKHDRVVEALQAKRRRRFRAPTPP